MKQEHIQPGDWLICKSTDIGQIGQYVSRWLLVTEERLWVFGDTEEPELLLALNFEDTTEFRSQSVVGSGLLQARVKGVFVDLLRFTNRRADIFQKVARKLDRKVHGQPIEIHPEELVDDRRCSSCGCW